MNSTSSAASSAIPSLRLPALDESSSAPDRCERRFNAIRAYLRRDGVGAEIGVFKGAFVEYLLSTGPSKLYLVDPWYRLAAKWRWAEGDKSTLNALLRILEEYRPEIEAQRIEPRIEFGAEFLESLPDDSLDWVYIDSSHSYEGTKEEVGLALRKVKPGGVIAGDDWHDDPSHRHHGVCKAVREFEAAGKLRMLVEGKDFQFVASALRE